LWLVP